MPASTSILAFSHPATTITHSLSCALISPDRNALVVASPHEIRVYEMSNDGAPDEQEPEHLVHIASIKLHGTISSMTAFTIAPSTRHSIAISYLEDAKISVVEWDDARNQLRTLSLHYLEDDVLKDGKCQMHQRVEAPLKVDPKSRCLAYMLFDTKLVILPLRDLSDLDDLPSRSQNTLPKSATERPAASHIQTNASTTNTTAPDDSTLPPPVGRHIIIDVAQRLGIRNVHDYCFLYGYSEPTLLILHENIQTWSAQLARRANTVSCTAVSLGIERNQYPIIWSVKALPHDAYRLVPLRQPIGGGALVLGHNSLIHVNHRAQYGLSTNDFAHLDICHPDQMAVHLEKQEDIALFLEVISYAFISPNVLALSLRSGELYLAHIFGNSNSVQKIILKKAKSTVVAATMCTLNGKYLFLGSRLGNSLLSEYRDKNKRKERPNGAQSEEPDRKRRRTEEQSTESLSSADHFLKMLAMDTEDMAANTFVAESNGAHQVCEFVFHVKDTFINIGPITSMAVGNVHTRGSDMDLKSRTDPRIELSTCSGHAKTGTICVLQRNLRPRYLANMKLLPQISSTHICDAIYYIDHNDEAIGKIIIATMGPRSIIMTPSINDSANNSGKKQSDTIEDNVFSRVENTRLQVNDPTLAVGALTADRKISVQVCPTKITLLKDAKIMYTKPFDIPIHSAHVLAPYVLLHFEDGTLKLFSCVGAQRKLTTKTVHLSMAMKSASLDASDKLPEAITATSLFRNKCRNGILFSMRDSTTGELVNPEYFAMVCWSNGAMEIYTVPDFKCVFSFMQFNELYGIMFDQNPSAEERDEFARKNKLTPLYVQEILMYCLSSELENPYLFVRMSNDSVHIYQTFSFDAQRAASSSVISSDILQQDNDNRFSHLRFAKIEHEFMDDILSKRNRSILRLDLLNKERHYSIFDKRFDTGLKRIVPFDDIGAYRGVFVCGKSPLWIMADMHNEIRIHPMTIDGPVSAFTPTTGRRFIYATSNSTNLKVHAEIRQPISAESTSGRKPHPISLDAGSFLRVATLRSDVLYDTHWPTKIVPLKKTPHHIVYEQETSTYSVSVSKPIAFENVEETLQGRFPKPQSLKFQVFLYSHKFEKMDDIEFDDFEQVLSMRVVSLMDRGEDPYNPQTGREKSLVTLLAIGTGIDGSEDDTCKGRVLLYDFKGSIEGDERFKFEKLAELELKGPVSAIESVDGYLSLSIGAKINNYYFNWEDKEIVQTSFFDSQYFTTSMKSIKNYILYGDMYESLNLLWWNEHGHQLNLLGKDPHRLLTYAVEFLYSDSELGLLVTDEERNVQVFRFAPEEASTHEGKWLLPVADVHVGSHINATIRLPARKTHPSERLAVELDTGMVVFATLEGEIGSIIPMDSASFKPLSLLQSKLYTQIAHACGLHPKAYRLFQPNSFNPIHIHQKNILDGELLKQYMHCDYKLQMLIAKQLGYRPADFNKALLKTLNKSTYF